MPISVFFFWKPLASVRLTAVGGNDGGSLLTYGKRYSESCNSDQSDLQSKVDQMGTETGGQTWEGVDGREIRWASEPVARPEKELMYLQEIESPP